MIEQIAAAPAPIAPVAPPIAPTDVMPMQKLADQLARIAPPAPVVPLATGYELPQPSPAVSAAIARSAALAAESARRARRAGSRSFAAMIVSGFAAACALVPYALIALVLRFVMARLFFLDGQSKVTGPLLQADAYGIQLSAVLPVQVKAETFAAFAAQYSALPISPMIAAYIVSYGEFLLPVLLLLGLATRFSALALLALIAVVQIYVMPQALWTAHVYWASILLVLISLGGGPLSLDHVIKLLKGR